MTRTGLAATLEVIFTVVAFGWRSWHQYRHTGSTGFIRPRMDAPPAERVGAASFAIALIGLAVAPAAAVGDAVRAGFDHPVVVVAGAALSVAGIVGCVYSQLAMGASWRIGVDQQARTELITSGIYAKVRNPIFSTMVLAGAGFTLLVPNLWAFGSFALLIAGIELQVRYVEEPYLRRVHGEDYDRYLATAGRFLPRW